MKKQMLLLLLGLLLAACGSSPPEIISPLVADPTYGFTEENPIMVGGGPDFGPLREQWYFNRLVGPEGEKVRYERTGSCCSFDPDSQHQTGGSLDMYEVSYRGLDKPVLLYVDMYQCEAPQAPKGFGLVEDPVAFKGTIYFAAMSAIFSGDYGLNIYALHGETQCLNPLPMPAPAFYPFSVSPDGARFAYTISDETTSRIMIFDLETRDALQVSPEDTWDEMPTWSPDGSRIAFARYTESDVDIYQYDLEDGGTSALLSTPDIDMEPVWSPDGEWIAFTSSRGGDADIFVADVDGSNIRQLTNNPSFETSPAWSQDGQHIAFVSDSNGSFDLYTMDLENEDVTRVRTPRGDVFYPNWSPNGNSIAFCLDDGTNVQIYKVNLDGSELEQLTSSTSASCFPVWR
jgi:TolB protein